MLRNKHTYSITNASYIELSLAEKNPSHHWFSYFQIASKY